MKIENVESLTFEVEGVGVANASYTKTVTVAEPEAISSEGIDIGGGLVLTEYENGEISYIYTLQGREDHLLNSQDPMNPRQPLA